MIEIIIMPIGHDLWNKTAEFAKNCSWRAGPYLASRMKNHAFESSERVIAAVEDDRIVAFCTFANRDELPDEYDITPFIGFVFVDEEYRGHRLSGRLIDAACEYAKQLNVSKIHIMSGEIGLYEKYGFEKIGDYKTIHDSVEQLFCRELSDRSDA